MELSENKKRQLGRIARSIVADDGLFESVEEFEEYMKDPSHKALATVSDKYGDGILSDEYEFVLQNGVARPANPIEDAITDGVVERMTFDQFVKFSGYSSLEQLIDDGCVRRI